MYLCISVLLTVICHFVLEDVSHSIFVAFSLEVNAKAEECDDQEAQDYTADYKQECVLFYKLLDVVAGICIIVNWLRNTLPWIGFVGPLANIASVILESWISSIVVFL